MNEFKGSVNLKSFFKDDPKSMDFVNKLNYASKQHLGTLINSPGAALKLMKNNKFVGLITTAGNLLIRTSSNLNKQSFAFVIGDSRDFINKSTESQKGYRMVSEMQAPINVGECQLESCVDMMKSIEFDEDITFIWRLAAAKNRDYHSIRFGTENKSDLPDFSSVTNRTDFDKLSINAKKAAIKIFPAYAEHLKTSNGINFYKDIVQPDVLSTMDNMLGAMTIDESSADIDESEDYTDDIDIMEFPDDCS